MNWRSTSYCYDDLPMYKILLDYLERFIESYEQKRHFSFWWTQDASHDYLNRVGMMDGDLEGFLNRAERRLENTVVVVFSDHGNRYDRIRETVGESPLLEIKGEFRSTADWKLAYRICLLDSRRRSKNSFPLSVALFLD